MILRWLRLNTLLSRSEPNRFFRVGRASDAQGGTGPMAVKPAEGTVSQVCRVCGGEVNPHGECVVCGTKQSDPPKSDDKGSATWLKGDSDGGLNAWIGASVAGGDSKDDALCKWLAGEDTAFQDWIGVPTTSGGAKTPRTPAERVSDDKVRELRTKALEVDGLHAELEAMRSTLNRELVNFREGKFDPVKYIEETANLSKQLQTFFFQAEDGIRDKLVTGVQTCALPISRRSATRCSMNLTSHSWEIPSKKLRMSRSRSEERRVGKECRSRWSPYH